MEEGELIVVVSRHPSGSTLLVTTRRLIYMADSHATCLPLTSISGVKPHLFAVPDKMYSMEIESDGRPVLVVRTEPGSVFHAILGLLVNFMARLPRARPAREAANDVNRPFDD